MGALSHLIGYRDTAAQQQQVSGSDSGTGQPDLSYFPPRPPGPPPPPPPRRPVLTSIGGAGVVRNPALSSYLTSTLSSAQSQLQPQAQVQPQPQPFCHPYSSTSMPASPFLSLSSSLREAAAPFSATQSPGTSALQCPSTPASALSFNSYDASFDGYGAGAGGLSQVYEPLLQSLGSHDASQYIPARHSVNIPIGQTTGGTPHLGIFAGSSVWSTDSVSAAGSWTQPSTSYNGWGHGHGHFPGNLVASIAMPPPPPDLNLASVLPEEVMGGPADALEANDWATSIMRNVMD